MGVDLPKFEIGQDGKTDKLKEIEDIEKQLAKRKAEELAKIEKHIKTVPKESNTDIYATIPKKTAALEVMRILTTSSYLGIGAIIGAFLILLAGTFNTFASYGVAILIIVPAAINVQKAKTEINRLKKEYNI